jgi:sulfonate transport system substrate-binding protein
MNRALAALILATLSFSGPAAAEERPTVIRIGVAGVGTGGRPLVGWSYSSNVAAHGALENEFRPDGIAIKWTYFSGAGPAVNEAIANKQLDFAFEGDLPALVARAGGLPTRVIIAHTRWEPIYIGVPSDSTAQRLEDLKGKRIAVFKGTNLQLAFYRVLEAKGLKDSDFKLVNMSFADASAALLSKDIDGAVTGPEVFPLVERGVARVVHSTAGDPKVGRLSHLLVTEDFNARHPQLVQRVVTAVLKEAAWLSNESNRGAAYEIWGRSGLGPPAWKGDWDPFVLSERASPLFDEFYRAQYKRALKAGRELKLVRRDFDTDAWLDPTYLNQALKALGLTGHWREYDAEGTPKATAPIVRR